MAEEIKKQNEAKKIPIVNGRDLNISKKQSLAVCKMIRGKTIKEAISMLEEVLQFKRVVKMNNMEIPHKHGKGVMAGRYPLKTAKEFIRLLKQLNANAIVNGIEPESYAIYCKADTAARPYRRGGMRAKRSHLFLKLEEKKHKSHGEKKK